MNRRARGHVEGALGRSGRLPEGPAEWHSHPAWSTSPGFVRSIARALASASGRFGRRSCGSCFRVRALLLGTDGATRSELIWSPRPHGRTSQMRPSLPTASRRECPLSFIRRKPMPRCFDRRRLVPVGVLPCRSPADPAHNGSAAGHGQHHRQRHRRPVRQRHVGRNGHLEPARQRRDSRHHRARLVVLRSGHVLLQYYRFARLHARQSGRRHDYRRPHGRNECAPRESPIAHALGDQ